MISILVDFLERNIPYLLYILRIAFMLIAIAVAFQLLC